MKQPKLIGRKARRIVKTACRGTPIAQYVAGPPILKLKEGTRVISSGKVEYGLPSYIKDLDVRH